jgi:hypothetical protein
LADPFDFTEADHDALLLKEKEIDNPTELRQFLVEFFSRTKTSGTTATSFFKGAKRLKEQKNIFDALPQDSRTRLKMPRTVVLKGMANGTYYHFGLEKGISNNLKTAKHRHSS